MTTYRNIHGRSIQAVTTDPSETVAEGQIWYNTGSDTFKTVLALEAWASSTSMSLARYNTGSFGIQTDAVVAGNDGTYVTTTEEYNGSGWSSGGALGTGRGASAGAGVVSTAGLIFGGFQGTANQAITESYDGSSFSEVSDMSTGRRILASAVQAPQSAGLAFGGFVTAASTATEEWGGSSWTNGGALPAAKYKHGGAGTQTAALSFGGIPAPGGSAQSTTEEYDGSSWTSGGTLGTAVEKCGGSGTQTLALCFGGPPDTDLTQKYDGTSWSNAPTLGTG